MVRGMKAEAVLDGYLLQQDDAVRFRVHFWERPKPGFAWNLDAWVLDDVLNVQEALSWVNANSRRRPYELFVETSGNLSDVYLVRISGENPNEP